MWLGYLCAQLPWHSGMHGMRTFKVNVVDFLRLVSLCYDMLLCFLRRRVQSVYRYRAAPADVLKFYLCVTPLISVVHGTSIKWVMVSPAHSVVTFFFHSKLLERFLYLSCWFIFYIYIIVNNINILFSIFVVD